MNLGEITKFIDNKIEQNCNKVVVSFFELKVKQNLSDEEMISIMQLISTRLTNMGYKVYKTGQKYIYESKEQVAKSNELLVAIK